jgi:hypothetical protein
MMSLMLFTRVGDLPAFQSQTAAHRHGSKPITARGTLVARAGNDAAGCKLAESSVIAGDDDGTAIIDCDGDICAGGNGCVLHIGCTPSDAPPPPIAKSGKNPPRAPYHTVSDSLFAQPDSPFAKDTNYRYR